jgi:hypothetical protein
MTSNSHRELGSHFAGDIAWSLLRVRPNPRKAPDSDAGGRRPRGLRDRRQPVFPRTGLARAGKARSQQRGPRRGAGGASQAHPGFEEPKPELRRNLRHPAAACSLHKSLPPTQRRVLSEAPMRTAAAVRAVWRPRRPHQALRMGQDAIASRLRARWITCVALEHVSKCRIGRSGRAAKATQHRRPRDASWLCPLQPRRTSGIPQLIALMASGRS